ncbi:MAG: aminotransferase class V-fold PLP-dependent enzyme [Thermodesulfobacteriota bacterium]|nr:aminotransferase class V-fold PLP-dependent enzyme [Thermodesulfobacteriota bacterium]
MQRQLKSDNREDLSRRADDSETVNAHTDRTHPGEPSSTAPPSSRLIADWNALMRTFIRPENEACRATLVKYMEQILFGLHEFLQRHVGITEEIRLKDLAKHYKNTVISDDPEKKLAEVIRELIKDISPHGVNVASPYFIGHMTSAIPFFMVHLKTIAAALNQNVVKLETSKVFSVLEKQVLAKIHRLIFDRPDSFYCEHVQNIHTTLGSFVEGGTTANLTALWVARNLAFSPKNGFQGIEVDGIVAAYREYEVQRSVVLVSRRGHYSLRKAGGLLGIGNANIIAIDVDDRHRLDIDCLKQTIQGIKTAGDTRILAVVGIAGATETGAIDPLRQIGEVCAGENLFFHVDAAWGGPTILSEKHKHLLDGIGLADSVTIDGHKQFYMPMSCGMVYFKDPFIMDAISYHANYVNRYGSVDLGIKSLSGSREANSLVLDSALKIMGKNGYALLIEHGIETARQFADLIRERELFEITTAPQLNILTYRVCPPALKQTILHGSEAEKAEAINRVNDINKTVQRLQREAGRSFVSRTTLMRRQHERGTVVLRCVIMNPMTDIKVLTDILDEQEAIYREHF